VAEEALQLLERREAVVLGRRARVLDDAVGVLGEVVVTSSPSLGSGAGGSGGT